MSLRTSLMSAAVASVLAITTAHAQKPPAGAKPTPGFNTYIPPDIMTPNTVPTRIGTLKFVDGVPTAETTKALYDQLDFQRGTGVFLRFMPAASVEAVRVGQASLGATKSHQAVIWDQTADSNQLYLTMNSDTVYTLAVLDLAADGPTVVEVPPGMGPTTVDDAFFRFVVDMGLPGPDAGKGGKYLIVPEWFKGPVPKDVKDGGEYFVARSPSAINLFVLRGFLVDGQPEPTSKLIRDKLKIYPLSQSANPPKMEFINASKQAFNTVHANTFKFYQELDDVIQREPLEFIDEELRGLAASVGIKKGQKFAPDERMTKILTDAVAVGNAMARAISFRNRDPRTVMWPNSQWKTTFVNNDYRWLDGDAMGGLNADARTFFFYLATVNTPKMTMKMVGKGSQYALAATDSAGNPLDGGKRYKLNIPANVPAANFWSVCVYDPQTRSELQTSQPYPSKNNRRDKMVANPDGSIDLYYGPPGTAPKGKEANWTETKPGKGWFTLFRAYGPLEPWFDKTWKPGEITLVK